MTSRPRTGLLRTGTALAMLVALAFPAFAQNKAPAATADFKRAYQAAVAEAADADTLDPAYELLGVAGNAREQNLTDMAHGAATAFADLIRRATATAQRKGGDAVQDALDQMVDLRFFAQTTQIAKTSSALDSAMRVLFPIVVHATEQRVDAAQSWEERLGALRDLVRLQASATQVDLQDMAASIALALNVRLAATESTAGSERDPDRRTLQLDEIAELKRSRSEQVDEATKNNLNAVAQKMQSTGNTAGSGEVSRGIDPEISQSPCAEAGIECPSAGGATPD